MSRILSAVFVTVSLLVLSPANASSSSIVWTLGNSHIGCNEAIDLALHLYAHMNLAGSPASNYDAGYIESIKAAKRHKGVTGDLGSQVQSFARAVMQNESLHSLAIFSAYYGDTRAYLKALHYMSGDAKALSALTAEDSRSAQAMAQQFRSSDRAAIRVFAQAAEAEYNRFYRHYWAEQESRWRSGGRMFYDIWSAWGYEGVRGFFSAHGKTHLRVYLSSSMRRNGRGLMYRSHAHPGAIVRMPEDRTQALNSYFLAVHEMLHSISDPMVYQALGVSPSQRSVNPGNQKGMAIHETVENAVIVLQYYLMRSISGDVGRDYLAFIRTISGKRVTDESSLRSSFPVPQGVRAGIDRLLSMGCVN